MLTACSFGWTKIGDVNQNMKQFHLALLLRNKFFLKVYHVTSNIYIIYMGVYTLKLNV